MKLAIHEVTGQEVALKMISRKNVTSRDMAGRVEREIAYLQLLRHPHIIKLYTVITTPKEIIMVIEYAGGELFDFLVSNGRVSEDKARRFFQQIICAVEYCHRHKIVHRDLKPENLLLDQYLNVKIADFGLSNIMTDGNFLKTSCGSPNYAAPEVIGGKLYAGPEVDVWSCGVILFVLLCGKLPFDDDYIPNLFKKIAQGKFSMPAFVSPDAKDLISRMLVVNPIQRITIAEIRKHPWFQTNLPEYLQPPKEEFFDTGVDVTKLPQLEELERGPVGKLEGELHDTVVGKVGSIMGYEKDDVQDALAKNEPSDIKDAYKIVRENHVMIPRLSMNAKNDGFMAQSPPAWDSFLPSSPQGFRPPQSPHGGARWGLSQSRTGSPLALNPSLPPPASGLGITTEEENLAGPQLAQRSPVSSVSILPSSIPAYHQAYMAGAPSTSTSLPTSSLRPGPKLRSNASPLDRFTPVLTGPPSGGTTSRRPRQTKWQFGIRSRNAPLEAVGCIYRALKRLGAEWVEEDVDIDEAGSDASGSGSDHNFSEDDGDEAEKHRERRRSKRFRARSRYPKDPWIINARWKKYAPRRTRRDGDSPTTPTSFTFTVDEKPAHEADDADFVYVLLTIQLYQLEHDNYLVDFKCAGYERPPPSHYQHTQNSDESIKGGERTTKKKVGFESRLGGDREGGTLKEDHHRQQQQKEGDETKEANSPFPFLDAAGMLIIALAEAAE